MCAQVNVMYIVWIVAMNVGLVLSLGLGLDFFMGDTKIPNLLANVSKHSLGVFLCVRRGVGAAHRRM